MLSAHIQVQIALMGSVPWPHGSTGKIGRNATTVRDGNRLQRSHRLLLAYTYVSDLVDFIFI
jgi:hypothetical protein